MKIQNGTDPSNGRTGRRGVAAGVAAGLLGGAAAGLVFGVPGLTSAADEPTVAGLVQQVDETDSPADDVEPGQRVRDVLQELVEDGTLTDVQADAVAAHLAEHRPERRFDREGHRGPEGPRGPGGLGSRAGGVMSEAVTDLLGLTPTELRERLRDGATLAEIADEQGIGTEALVAEIVGEIEERIAQGVESGRLDQADADEKLAEAEERVTDMVENGLPHRGQD